MCYTRLSIYLCGGVLGDSLGALGDGMLGKLTGKDKTDGRLHIAAGHGGVAVDAAQLGGLRGDLLERVSDEVVDDRNALLGDAGLRVHLLHHLEDVGVEGLLALTALDDRGLLIRLLRGRHCDKSSTNFATN